MVLLKVWGRLVVRILPERDGSVIDRYRCGRARGRQPLATSGRPTDGAPRYDSQPVAPGVRERSICRPNTWYLSVLVGTYWDSPQLRRTNESQVVPIVTSTIRTRIPLGAPTGTPQVPRRLVHVEATSLAFRISLERLRSLHSRPRAPRARLSPVDGAGPADAPICPAFDMRRPATYGSILK